MKTKIYFPVIVLIILIAVGCAKNQEGTGPNGKVELYMLTGFSKIENSSEINESTVVTKETPLIYYSDFLSYNSKEYEFELSERAVKAIDELEHSVFGLPFAIKANNELIYVGYFWPSYSSASCNCIVIDPTMTSIGNKIKVKLGYPGLAEGQTIEDKRNDSRIINIFKRDNKLK